MNWDDLNTLVEHAEAWTALLINAWIILTGIIVCIYVVFRNQEPTLASVVRAALLAIFLMVCGCVGAMITAVIQRWLLHEAFPSYLSIEVAASGVLAGLICLLLVMFRIVPKSWRDTFDEWKV